MGQPFELVPSHGPVPAWRVGKMADVERLEAEPAPGRYQHIRDLLRRVKEELRGALPVLVFAGAPFTVATYSIGTGKDMEATRRFAAAEPLVWGALLERLEAATVGFLRTLVADGADAYQLFDSWAGLLTEGEYDRWAQPFHQRILRQAAGVPRILFVKGCPYLERLCAAGAEVVSLGHRHDLAAARAAYPGLVFQGNVDSRLLKNGTPEEVARATRACVAAGGGRRHIVNLDHGVDRGTPVENFAAFVRAVRGDSGV
jgi:uroporphyrinogen decarboxylase